MASVEEI